jgi:hypothetical protein
VDRRGPAGGRSDALQTSGPIALTAPTARPVVAAAVCASKPFDTALWGRVQVGFGPVVEVCSLKTSRATCSGVVCCLGEPLAEADPSLVGGDAVRGHEDTDGLVDREPGPQRL